MKSFCQGTGWSGDLEIGPTTKQISNKSTKFIANPQPVASFSWANTHVCIPFANCADRIALACLLGFFFANSQKLAKSRNTRHDGQYVAVQNEDCGFVCFSCVHVCTCALSRCTYNSRERKSGRFQPSCKFHMYHNDSCHHFGWFCFSFSW